MWTVLLLRVLCFIEICNRFIFVMLQLAAYKIIPVANLFFVFCELLRNYKL